MVDPKLLREVPFFHDLTDNEVAVMSTVVNRQNFKIGDTIFKESEDGAALYIIKKGEVKACKTAPDGELFTLTIMKDGEIFGERSFLDGRPRQATGVAGSDLAAHVTDEKDPGA